MRWTRRNDLYEILRDIAGKRNLSLLADADVLEFHPSSLPRVPVFYVDRKSHARHLHAGVPEREKLVERKTEITPLVAAPNYLLCTVQPVGFSAGHLHKRRDANQTPRRRSAGKHKHLLRPHVAVDPTKDVRLRKFKMGFPPAPPHVEPPGGKLPQPVDAADSVRCVHRPPLPLHRRLLGKRFENGTCRNGGDRQNCNHFLHGLNPCLSLNFDFRRRKTVGRSAKHGPSRSRSAYDGKTTSAMEGMRFYVFERIVSLGIRVGK